jgi:hypothetical protein
MVGYEVIDCIKKVVERRQKRGAGVVNLWWYLEHLKRDIWKMSNGIKIEIIRMQHKLLKGG